MGKFIDLIESRYRDYRDRDEEDEEEVSYPDPLGNRYKSVDDVKTTQPDPLGSHNKLPEPETEPEEQPIDPEPEEQPIDPEPEVSAVDDTPEPSVDTEEQTVEQLLASIDEPRKGMITRINDHFNAL